MKFINRDSEIKELEYIANLSDKKLFTTLVYGPRRVGKTELVKHFSKNRPHIYFFVYENKTKESLLKEFETELKDGGYISDEVEIKDLDSFIRLLFHECEGVTIIFDEVQYMLKIYPAFFSVLQKEIDENQEKKMHIIFLGSIVGLIKNVFEDTKSPLYGRIKSHIKLNPVSYKNTRLFLREMKYDREEDFMKFYSIFGGYPKYYVAMEDYMLFSKNFDEVIRFLFFRDNAPFRNEVLSVLRQEFGAGKSYYYTILEAIATGHTKLSQIAACMERTSTAIMPFMDDLMNYYEMIERISPVTAKKSKRKSIYAIKNPLFRFWFRYVYPNQGYFENGQYDNVFQKFKDTSNAFFGKGFEIISKDFLIEMNRKKRLPFIFSKIGPVWGKDRQKNVFEIDISAISADTRQILFCECKWKENVNPKKILFDLKEKSAHVQWHNETRKEHYAIFAKSFKEKPKEEIEKLKDQNVMLFDLKAIESLLEH